MKKFEAQKILVTGANGFIGRNLAQWLRDETGAEILEFVRGDSLDALENMVLSASKIVHLAGVNRPRDLDDFNTDNIELTRKLCSILCDSGLHIPLIFISSSQAELSNPYGISKLTAENLVGELADKTHLPVTIFRLPGIFGKWSKPNYNSVVATFCFNIARNYDVEIHDRNVNIDLCFIDDLNKDIAASLDNQTPGLSWGRLSKVYSTTIGDLADQIYAFKSSRVNLISERVGTDFVRALYSTYVSFLPVEEFVYDLPINGDERGIFVEMLKTPDCGQFSFFTIRPGVTRGSHYHHTKTEKFIVVKGFAIMRYRDLVTQEIVEIKVSEEKPQIVDSIPGWVHDITNVGDSELIAMLWANEIYDPESPDTIGQLV